MRSLALIAVVLLGLSSATASAAETSYTIDTFAGTGTRGSRDGALKDAEFYDPGNIAMAPDGTMYIADSLNGVRTVKDGMVGTLPLPWATHYASGVAVKGNTLYVAVAVDDPISPSKLRSTIATYDLTTGTTRELLPPCPPGGDLSRYSCRLRADRLAVLGDELLVSTFLESEVYSVGSGGTEVLYAGKTDDPADELGVDVLNEGGASQGARIDVVTSIDVDEAGTIYLGDFGHCLVRRVDLKGIIRTVVGGKGLKSISGDVACGYSGDGGPAAQAGLDLDTNFRVGRSEDLFIAHQKRIRHVDSKGIISTIAGKEDSFCAAAGGGGCCAGDGGPALEAELSRPLLGAVGNDGAVYFVETDGCPRVRVLRPAR